MQSLQNVTKLQRVTYNIEKQRRKCELKPTSECIWEGNCKRGQWRIPRPLSTQTVAGSWDSIDFNSSSPISLHPTSFCGRWSRRGIRENSCQKVKEGKRGGTGYKNVLPITMKIYELKLWFMDPPIHLNLTSKSKSPI